jgi:two-component system LytT family response regulator
MLEAIAIDDEPMALGVIKKFIPAVPFVHLLNSFTSARDGIEFLEHGKVDLIFLDIRMPDMSGIDLFTSLEDPPLVVFTTAYSEHAVESFEVNAVDYLLKPFSFERFEQACVKAQQVYHWRQQGSNPKPSHFFIRSGYDSVKIEFDEILYIESTGNYVQFVLKDRKVITRLTITEAQTILLPPDFIRTHRRFIVAKKHVTQVNKKILQIGSIELPVGETYWSHTRKQF